MAIVRSGLLTSVALTGTVRFGVSLLTVLWGPSAQHMGIFVKCAAGMGRHGYVESRSTLREVRTNEAVLLCRPIAAGTRERPRARETAALESRSKTRDDRFGKRKGPGHSKTVIPKRGGETPGLLTFWEFFWIRNAGAVRRGSRRRRRCPRRASCRSWTRRRVGRQSLQRRQASHEMARAQASEKSANAMDKIGNAAMIKVFENT